MAAAGGGVVPAGTLAADARRALLRLLMAVMNFLEINGADLHTHPIYLALAKSAILRFNGDLIFLTADAIDNMTHDNPTTHSEVKLKMAYKLQL